jgi:hypothetical protein
MAAAGNCFPRPASSLSYHAIEAGNIARRRRTATSCASTGAGQSESVRLPEGRVHNPTDKLSGHHRGQRDHAAEPAITFRGGWVPAADSLRQRRQSATRQSDGANPRNGNPAFDGRAARPNRAAIADRKRPGFAARRLARSTVRVLDHAIDGGVDAEFLRAQRGADRESSSALRRPFSRRGQTWLRR